MINDPNSSHRTIAEYVERLGRSVQGVAYACGLNPAQWAALRYFSRANRFSRTVGAFAQYQGTTRGTATQTVKALLEKGYLRRHSNKQDHRSFHLELSAKALEILKKDPLQELVTAAGALSSKQSYEVIIALTRMLEYVSSKHGQPLFGLCGLSCRYLCENNTPGKHCYQCELYGEPINSEELAGFCVNYAPLPE